MSAEIDREPVSGVSSQATMRAGAVFLSYASEDGPAAERIATALRNAGVEVWFDKSELRGGDAWDRQIRTQIHNCALFIPIISAHAQARLEGYFRREWKLAADRTHDMAEEKAFLVPIVIDDTTERNASVPDKFRDVQWSRLPAGETPRAFVERVTRLLSSEAAHAPAEMRSPAAAAAHAASAPKQPAASPTTSRQTRWLPLAVVAFAVIVAGYFGVDKFVLSKRPGAGAQASVAANRPAAPVQSGLSEKSIAVLPFVDLSEKHDQEYFADGLAEQILNELSRVPGLKVIGRTSSFRFRDKTDNLLELGRVLGAIYVLEGSVRRERDQIRVTAQLINSRDGSHLWSQTYDRNSGNVLRLQEEIATAIARTLQVTITDYFKQQYTTRSPEAFDLYLRGIRDLDLASADSTRRALAEFERASQLDPRFIPAVIGQASAYNALGGNAYMAPNEVYPRARLAIERALTIDPRSADAHAMRALIRVNYDRDWDGAATDLAKAEEFGGSRIAYLPAAKIAGAMGDPARAAELFEAQLATDPLDSEALMDLAWFVYPALGRYEDADALLRRAREVDPEYTNDIAYFAGINLLLRGRLDEATALVEDERDDSAREALRAAIDHARGRSREADAAILRAISARNAWPWAIARAYAYRGDKPRALEWLDKTAAYHEASLWTVRTDPMLRVLAGDAGFRAFLHKINIPD